MSDFYVIRNAREEINISESSISSVQHHVEKKRIRSVGKCNANGAPLTATSTSNAKLSLTSTAEGNSIISSISMSLERKNSIQYVPSKVAPCIIPTGQSTVIHMINYTHFMAQRITTKTATKKTKSNDSDTMLHNTVDVDLKVILGGVNFSHNSNILEMNTQKLLDAKTITSSKRGRKKSLSLGRKQHKQNKIIDQKIKKSGFSTTQKQTTLKKAKITRHKKAVKPHQSRKFKRDFVADQEHSSIVNEKTNQGELEKLELSSTSTQFTSESKVLQPCVFTTQNRKCPSEIYCRYLHSDFPCKYYYLNLLCPYGFKCQFMHNGPLEPKLIDALRIHILDLMSAKPTHVEVHFIQEMHNIEDISQRLLFVHNKQLQNCEVIEVMNEGDDDVLIIDETSVSNNNNFNDAISADSPSDDTDVLYKTLKETSSKIDEIERKLKSFKNSTNITPNEKFHELQKIYEQLKEQEKRLPICENHNISANAIHKNAALPLASSSTIDDEQHHHIVLVDPDIINDVENFDSQENGVVEIISGQENALTTFADPECRQSTTLNALKLNGTEIVFYENLSPSCESETIVINEGLKHQDPVVNNATTSIQKECEVIDFNIPRNIDFKEEKAIKNIEISFNNSNLNAEEYSKIAEIDNEPLEIHSDAYGKLEIENDPSIIVDLDSDKGDDMDDKVDLNNSLIPLNQYQNLDLDITNDKIEFNENINDNVAVTESVAVKTPPYQVLKTGKPENTNCRRLRSHTLQESLEECKNNVHSNHLTATNSQQITPIKTRRLKLPKPSKKKLEKSKSGDCQINADIINKLVDSGEDCKSLHNKNINTPNLQNEVFSTENVILSKRLIKKNKAKLEQQSLLHEAACSNDIHTDKDLDFSLTSHRAAVKNLNNNESSGDDHHDLNSSLSLTVVNDCDGGTVENKSLKHHVFFKTLTSSRHASSDTSIPKRFNIRHPYVVLTKIKNPFVRRTENDVQTSSTRSNVKPTVSSTELTDMRSTQKRQNQNLASEYDSDSSSKAHKCLKIDNDTRYRNDSEQSSCDDAKDDYLDIVASNERAALDNVAMYNISDDQEILESSASDVLTIHQHECEHKEQQKNNLDSQLQTKQRKQQEHKQNKNERIPKATTSSFSSESSNNFAYDEDDLKKLLPKEQYKNNMGEEIANALNSYDAVEKEEEGAAQAFVFKSIHEPKKPTATPNKKSLNETTTTDQINLEYSTYSSLFKTLSSHSTKCSINVSANITPISSPTHADNTIASPSPTSKSTDFRMGAEIDGSLTNPPTPYFLYEIDLEKIMINKPICMDKLKRTIQLDPRIFKSHNKKELTLWKPSTSAPSNNSNISNASSLVSQPISSTISPFDPRNRTPAIVTDITTPSLSQQTDLTPCNSTQTAITSPQLSSCYMYEGTPNSMPLALQYHNTSQPIILPQTQPQLQQTPNMFLYGCLQRSPWYQSLISTMKIQINQSISQLVRALNNYHRERLLNPEMVFDVFKIDCAGELLEIMRNLGIYVDLNGIINEHTRNVLPSFSERFSCCSSALPVNATYSFIQQVLTPNTHCKASMSCCHTAAGQLNVNEPFVSCYLNTSEPTPKKRSDDYVTTRHAHHDDNNSNRNFNNSNSYNTYNSNKRHNNQCSKFYHNNKFHNSFHQGSNQRYNSYNKPRFKKPGYSSPSTSSNNRRFNNYDNNGEKYKNNNDKKLPWSSAHSNSNRYNHKYSKYSYSPPRTSSPHLSHQSESPPHPSCGKTTEKYSSSEEECWD